MKNDWIDLLRESASKPERVPDGWKTAREIAIELGLSENTVTTKLRRLIAEKKVETKKFTVQAGTRIIPVMHYRRIR